MLSNPNHQVTEDENIIAVEIIEEVDCVEDN